MEALSRCVAVLTASSKAEDMAVQVQQHKHISERMKSKLTAVNVELDCVFFRCAGTSVGAIASLLSSRNAGRKLLSFPTLLEMCVTFSTMAR